jgi:hypothetical protein
MPDKSLVFQWIYMADPIWLCLFKADFTDKANIKGDLRVKIKLEDFRELTVDTKDPKKVIAHLPQANL